MRVTQKHHQRGTAKLVYREVVWSSETSRRVVLLHGAGVAGVLTWGSVLPELEGLGQAFVPDLYGAGDTSDDRGEAPFTIDELHDHVAQCLLEIGWEQFDIVGYSFGGLLAMRLAADPRFVVGQSVLIEAALMEREDWQETLVRRRLYTQATQPLKNQADPEHGVRAFLDLVSPDRSRHPRVERRVVARLAHRPCGLANALEAVAELAETLDRPSLIRQQPRTLSLVGAKTPQAAHQLHQRLAQTIESWSYRSIEGCDHALPYQKPQALARAVNRFFTSSDVLSR